MQGYPAAGNPYGGTPSPSGTTPYGANPGAVSGYPTPAGGGQPQQQGYPGQQQAPVGYPGGQQVPQSAYGGASSPPAFDEEFVIVDEYGNETPVSNEEGMAAGGEGQRYEKNLQTNDPTMTREGDRGIGKILLGAAAAGVLVWQKKSHKKTPYPTFCSSPPNHAFFRRTNHFPQPFSPPYRSTASKEFSRSVRSVPPLEASEEPPPASPDLPILELQPQEPQQGTLLHPVPSQAIHLHQGRTHSRVLGLQGTRLQEARSSRDTLVHQGVLQGTLRQERRLGVTHQQGGRPPQDTQVSQVSRDSRKQDTPGQPLQAIQERVSLSQAGGTLLQESVGRRDTLERKLGFLDSNLKGDTRGSSSEEVDLRCEVFG